MLSGDFLIFFNITESVSQKCHLKNEHFVLCSSSTQIMLGPKAKNIQDNSKDLKDVIQKRVDWFALQINWVVSTGSCFGVFIVDFEHDLSIDLLVNNKAPKRRSWFLNCVYR